MCPNLGAYKLKNVKNIFQYRIQIFLLVGFVIIYKERHSVAVKGPKNWTWPVFSERTHDPTNYGRLSTI